jgi:uncharacterized protein
MSIYKEAAEKGWVVMPNIDGIRSLGFCSADYPNRYMVNLNGNVFKCGQTFSAEESVGRVNRKGLLELNQAKCHTWVNKDPSQFEECKVCPFVPICMGGCTLKRSFMANEDCCVDWKYNVPGFLEVLVLNQRNIEDTNKEASI